MSSHHKTRPLLMIFLSTAFAAVVSASAPSGAIFTTVADGSEVNYNIYPNKEAVYLDGGPGPGAPQTAAGLDDGTYVFQVTDPSGKKLLSTDEARCRQFVVTDGIITSVVATGCEHNTGLDVDHGATTVQLMPYLDTPNNGGVYKVWATKVEDYRLQPGRRRLRLHGRQQRPRLLAVRQQDRQLQGQEPGAAGNRYGVFLRHQRQ